MLLVKFKMFLHSKKCSDMFSRVMPLAIKLKRDGDRIFFCEQICICLLPFKILPLVIKSYTRLCSGITGLYCNCRHHVNQSSELQKIQNYSYQSRKETSLEGRSFQVNSHKFKYLIYIFDSDLVWRCNSWLWMVIHSCCVCGEFLTFNAY